MKRTKVSKPKEVTLRRLNDPIPKKVRFKKEETLKRKKKKKSKKKTKYYVKHAIDNCYYGYVAGFRRSPVLMDYDTAVKLLHDLKQIYYGDFIMRSFK